MKPRRLTDEQLATVTKLARYGSHPATIANQLGMDVRTWRRVLERDKRAARAFEVGHAKEHDFWLQSLMQQADRGPVPAIFALKSRHGYKDQPDPVAEPARIMIVQLPAAAKLEDYRPPALEHEVSPVPESPDAKRS
jgi:hypothetical protein